MPWLTNVICTAQHKIGSRPLGDFKYMGRYLSRWYHMGVCLKSFQCWQKKKPAKLHITGPLCWESTGDSPHKGQWCKKLPMSWINHMLGSRGAFNYIMKCLAYWLRRPQYLLSTHFNYGPIWPELWSNQRWNTIKVSNVHISWTILCYIREFEKNDMTQQMLITMISPYNTPMAPVQINSMICCNYQI